MRILFKTNERGGEVWSCNQALQDRIHEASVKLAILQSQERIAVLLHQHRRSRLAQIKAALIRCCFDPRADQSTGFANIHGRSDIDVVKLSSNVIIIRARSRLELITLLTASIRRRLLLLLTAVSAGARGVLTVLDHHLLVSQFLNRALVLLADPLQPVLHPVSRVFTVSIVAAMAIGSTLRSISLVHVLVVAAPLRIVVTRLTAHEGG